MYVSNMTYIELDVEDLILSAMPPNLHTFPRSTPVPDSQMSIRIPKPSRERAQVFGYPPVRLDFDPGQKHNVDRLTSVRRLY